MTDMRKALELLPCPFCGEQQIYLNESNGSHKRSINCPSCLAVIFDECGVDELIAVWNSRAASPQAAPAGVMKYKPIAYAIYGIGGGMISLFDVREIKNDEWIHDDGYLGDSGKPAEQGEE